MNYFLADDTVTITQSKVANSGIKKIVVNTSYKHISVKKSINNLKLRAKE